MAHLKPAAVAVIFLLLITERPQQERNVKSRRVEVNF